MHYSAYDPFYIIVHNENPRCDAGVIKYYFVVDSRRINWNPQAKYPKKTDKEGKKHRTSWFRFRFVQIDPEYRKKPNEDRSETPSEIHGVLLDYFVHSKLKLFFSFLQLYRANVEE